MDLGNLLYMSHANFFPKYAWVGPCHSHLLENSIQPAVEGDSQQVGQ